MGKTKLREILEELHGELESAESVEPETQKLMKSVLDDIQEVLERAEPRSPEEEESISGRLSQAVVEFENSHPRVSFAVERLLKGLADIGI